MGDVDDSLIRSDLPVECVRVPDARNPLDLVPALYALMAGGHGGLRRWRPEKAALDLPCEPGLLEHRGSEAVPGGEVAIFSNGASPRDQGSWQGSEKERVATFRRRGLARIAPAGRVPLDVDVVVSAGRQGGADG